MKLTGEGRRIQELQKQVEKQKQDKQHLQEKIKKLNEELDMKESIISDLRNQKDSSFISAKRDKASVYGIDPISL